MKIPFAFRVSEVLPKNREHRTKQRLKLKPGGFRRKRWYLLIDQR